MKIYSHNIAELLNAISLKDPGYTMNKNELIQLVNLIKILIDQRNKYKNKYKSIKNLGTNTYPRLARRAQAYGNAYGYSFGKNIITRFYHPDFVDTSSNPPKNKLRIDNDMISYSNPTSNLVYLTVSTNPSIESYGLEKVIENFNYNRVLLGSTTATPQPQSGPLFRYLFWRWRLDRYHEGLKDIKIQNPDAVVLMTDADDVTIVESPDVVLHKFENFKRNGFKIVFSGQIYCCNIDRLKYLMKIFNVADEAALTSAIAGKEKYFLKIIDSMWNQEDISKGINPGLTWTPEGEAIITALKNLPLNTDDSPYRYINAGTIIGEVDALIELIQDVKNDYTQYTFSLDDEGTYNTWFSSSTNRTRSTTKATIDYKQEIFAVVDEFENRDNERKFLVDSTSNEFTKLKIDPVDKKITNQYNKKPAVFHYAGYKSSFLQGIRNWVINNAPKLNWLKTSSDQNIKNFLKEIKRCGNRNETQNSQQICEHLYCKYDNSLPNGEKCELPSKPTRTYDIWEEDWIINFITSGP